MKTIVLYSVILSALLVGLYYFQLTDFFEQNLDGLVAGLVLAVIIGAVTLLGVNQVIKDSREGTYSYGLGVISALAFNGFGIFLYACLILYLEYGLEPYSKGFSKIFFLLTQAPLGWATIAAILVPMTFRSEKVE